MSRYSNSSINQYAMCPLSYRYKYLLKLHPIEAESAHHLVFGRAGHEALRVLYTENDLDAAKAALRAHYPVQLDPDDRAKTADNGCLVLDGYVRQYDWDKNWEVLACEDMDATEDAHVVKLDLVVRDTNTGSILGVDHKWTKSLLNYKYWSKYDPNSQVTQYIRYIKEKYGHCDGFIVNAISLQWLNEKDKAGRWNGKYYDVNDPERLVWSHREVRYVKYYKKDMCAAWGLKVEFERQMLQRTEQQISQDNQSRLYWIKSIEQAKEQDGWAMNTQQCFLCQYQMACGAGWDWEHDSSLILNHYRQVCDKWIPEEEMHCTQDLGHEGGCHFELPDVNAGQPEFAVEVAE